ncbi:MAG: bifunctional oligoribonuclease/PAP phosphatase NrnA [Clostridia bacterium]|nr:bifunctional oligoribonuclease/PAP phosphatase NrnA [Clostridia bacterium]
MRKIDLSQLQGEVKIPKYTLILCHRNPDPDTLGSAFGLKAILEHYGSRVRVACCDKTTRLCFITENADLDYQEDNYERIIAVDVASPTQLGELSYLSDRVDLTIDHHAMNTRFSDYYEDLCSACSEIIFELARELNILSELPKHFFESVYAGISGDTGCFKYSNTTKRTMEFGAEIISYGIDFAEINRLIFDTKTLGEIKGQELAYKNVKLLCGGKLAIVLFTKQMREDNGISDEDIGDIVNSIRSIEGVTVAVSIKQATNDENKYSISSRSNCEADVSRACAKIGGGGHIRAAGATLVAGSPEEALSTVTKLFEGII